MPRHLSISLVLALLTAGVNLRAATNPHAAPASATATWTNEDLGRLSRIPGLISVVGQPANQATHDGETSEWRSRAKDAAWYRAQAAELQAQLESEKAELHDFNRAIEDARELKTTTGGVNLLQNEIALTPEGSIAVLQNRVSETESELDSLEDLARHHSIQPGILRGDLRDVPDSDNLEITTRKDE